MCVCVRGVGRSVERSVGWRGIYREEEEEARTDRRVGRERKTGRQMWGWGVGCSGVSAGFIEIFCESCCMCFQCSFSCFRTSQSFTGGLSGS